MNWTIGGLLAFAVSYASYRFKLLTLDGSLAAFCLGCIIFSLGGWTFSLPILIFFVSSNLISRIGRKKTFESEASFEKGGQRDARQVLANGLVPTILLAAWAYSNQPRWAWLFLGAVAAATADTWATEIGVHSRSQPRSIVNFKRVPTGTSGGISWLGTLAALLGALAIAVSGFIVFHNHPQIDFSTKQILSVALVGVVGQTLDSILGATLQARFRCEKCGQISERGFHCRGSRTSKIRGLRWFDNDFVNLTAIILAAAFGWISLTVLW